jgi:hypothetical protein
MHDETKLADDVPRIVKMCGPERFQETPTESVLIH